MCDLKEKPRENWIDTAKGIAVVLVVIGHVYGVCIEEPSSLFMNIIASLHNPTFYLCSGILFSMTEIGNEYKFLLAKALDLVMVFVIWCMLYAAYAKTLIKITDSEYLYSYWDTMNKLWFFPILFIAFCVAVFLKKVRFNRNIIWGGVIFVGMTVSAFVSSMLAKIACYTIIFLLGICFSVYKEKKKNYMYFCMGVWASVAVCYMTGVIVLTDGFVPGVKLLIMLVSFITGGTSFVWIIYHFGVHLSGRMIKLIQSIGQNSLYIYILHYIFVYLLQILVCRKIVYMFLAGIASLIFPVGFARMIRGSIVEKLLFKPSKFYKPLR